MVPKPLRPGQQCFTSGWGHTSVDGTPGTILKAVKMKIKEPVHCRKGIFLLKNFSFVLGVPGVPWHTQILADQLTLFQPRGTDYAHLITTGTPGFSDLPTALQ